MSGRTGPERADELERQRQWVAREGVAQSQTYCGDPLHWLEGGRPRRFDNWNRPQWFDHGTRWNKDGKPYCLVGQPYGLSDDDIAELAHLQKRGFEVSVSTWPAWHYPHHVLHVEVRRGGAR
jgi:hypothetical protein